MEPPLKVKECTTTTKEKQVCVKENKRTFSINNPDNRLIDKVRVDGCIYKDNSTKRCDWLFHIRSIKKSVFVELKGKNVSHAYEQLSETINAMAKTGWASECFIICSRVPRQGPSVQALKKSMKKLHSADLKVKQCQFDYQL